MIGIYKIVNVVNDKVYVGSAVNIERRWRQHKKDLKENKHHSIHFQNAWDKYSESNFQFELIEGILIKEKNYILEREQYWLDYYNSYERDKGYNICEVAGSSLGRKTSEKTKQKMSESFKGDNHPMFGKHHSEKSKQKISEAKKGKHLSEETKQKMSEVHKGKYPSEETKRKISGENHHFFGKHHSEKSKQKISEAKKGKNNSFFGKHHSEETKQKMSKAQIGENGNNSKLTWIIVREIREKYKLGNILYLNLAKQYGVSISCIQYIINNRTWKETNNE